jgi:Rrf2 family transcriptional regulator, nitric oxide-sensitive transcriptional repressor
MRLTLHTDYSLRVLLYLAASESGTATITELADFYEISRNHLVKVVHHLGLKGYIQTMRGKNGGICLARPPEQISIGEVVKNTEPDLNLLECFDQKTDHCVISSDCRLKGLLFRARDQFVKELEKSTLADVAAPMQQAWTHKATIPVKPR